MKLQTTITQYVSYHKSLGEKFSSNETILKAFIKAIGHDRNLSDVRAEEIATFIAGNGPITAHWHNKHKVLRGFYRYALQRGYTKESPLPTVIPKRPQPLIPYIYSVEELNALLDASLAYQKVKGKFEPYMVRTLLLLLYGAGLRISEAINLTLADVDLSQGLITIRETKFYKTRLVPLRAQLTQSLLQYTLQRRKKRHPINPETPFFIGRNKKVINLSTIEDNFRRICRKAGIRRSDNSRYGTRIHDLRHTFAVHRLTQGYKEGVDVQKLLPALSVYMGHTNVSSTSVYLTMTPALLEEAGHRFQIYAFKEESHE